MEWRIDAGGLAAILTAIVALYVAIRKGIPEKASTAATYQSIAFKQAEEAKVLRADNKKLRDEIHDLEERVSDLEENVRQRDALIDEWQYGIERLVKQLESHEMKPVWIPPKRVVTAIEVQE